MARKGPTAAIYKFSFVSEQSIGYDGALWPKKLEISHASQILTKGSFFVI